MPRNETPDASVREVAAQYGVDLATVKGGGAGGRIRPIDVLAAAGVPVYDPPKTAPAASAGSAGRSVGLAGGATRKGPGYERNPLAAAARAAVIRASAQAPTTPAPSVFAAGDLPSFTVSGIPPEALLDVPWQARHAMAAVSTPGEAYAIANECSGPDAAETAAMMFGNHPGNADYRDRVEQWRVQSLTDAALARDMTSAGLRERTRRAAATLGGPVRDDAEEQAAISALAGGRLNVSNGRGAGQPSDPNRQ